MKKALPAGLAIAVALIAALAYFGGPTDRKGSLSSPVAANGTGGSNPAPTALSVENMPATRVPDPVRPAAPGTEPSSPTTPQPASSADGKLREVLEQALADPRSFEEKCADLGAEELKANLEMLDGLLRAQTEGRPPEGQAALDPDQLEILKHEVEWLAARVRG